MASKQAKISIPKKEKELADATAKKLHYDNTTEFIRHIIRQNCAGAVTTTLTQPQITTSSTPTQQNLTISNLKQIYRARYAMAKKLGFAAWFVEVFGTEEMWLSQFTVMPYDKEEQF